MLEKHGHPGAIRIPEPILVSDWFAPGYGCSTQAIDALMRRGRKAGLTLDRSYSGKAFGEYLKRL